MRARWCGSTKRACLSGDTENITSRAGPEYFRLGKGATSVRERKADFASSGHFAHLPLLLS